MIQPDLLPCRHCGSSSAPQLFANDPGKFTISCCTKDGGCGVKTPSKGVDEVIQIWNMSAIPAQIIWISCSHMLPLGGGVVDVLTSELELGEARYSEALNCFHLRSGGVVKNVVAWKLQDQDAFDINTLVQSS